MFFKKYKILIFESFIYISLSFLLLSFLYKGVNKSYNIYKNNNNVFNKMLINFENNKTIICLKNKKKIIIIKKKNWFIKKDLNNNIIIYNIKTKNYYKKDKEHFIKECFIQNDKKKGK